MAIDFTAKYPGRFDPVSALYPQGKFKNRSAPNTEDGSYMERDWLNDWNGFFGALLKNANVTPNGTVDTATASQLYDALRILMLGILPKRTFAANDFIRIPDTPGGLIIQWGTVLTSNGVGTLQLSTSYPKAHFVTLLTDQAGAVSSCDVWGVGPLAQSSAPVYSATNSGAAASTAAFYISIGD